MFTLIKCVRTTSEWRLLSKLNFGEMSIWNVNSKRALTTILWMLSLNPDDTCSKTAKWFNVCTWSVFNGYSCPFRSAAHWFTLNLRTRPRRDPPAHTARNRRSTSRGNIQRRSHPAFPWRWRQWSENAPRSNADIRSRSYQRPSPVSGWWEKMDAVKSPKRRIWDGIKPPGEL